MVEKVADGLYQSVSAHTEIVRGPARAHGNYAFPLKGGPRSKIPVLNALWNIKVLKYYFLQSLPMIIT